MLLTFIWGMKKLAKAVGYKTHGIANLHYQRLAHNLCEMVAYFLLKITITVFIEVMNSATTVFWWSCVGLDNFSST